VVKQCSAVTLFENVFQSDATAKKSNELKNTNLDLVNFVDKCLKRNGLPKSSKEFSDWKKECMQPTRRKPQQGKRRKLVDKKMGMRDLENRKLFYARKDAYETVMKIAKEEWLLSTDGVVKALRYDAKQKQFVAKVSYQQEKKVKEAHMILDDDWVIDAYGKELAKKLIDHGEHEGFLLPLDKDGKLATFKMDDRNIIRVKYVPPTFVHQYHKKSGVDLGATGEVHSKACWKGLLHDKTVVDLPEQEIEKQFGAQFLNECKRLGRQKFVPIPVGSCRSSVIELFPYLRCEKAPRINYMQGEIDSCVLSSLASAFHQTSIPDLVRTASILQQKTKKHSGGTKCLAMAKDIVVQNVKWLQPKRLPNNFNWEDDINDYMFVVGAIKDSTNCCQHAVTIFWNWIYDSNEPFALPLSKQSLDCCTWDIKDGAIDHASLFVSFTNGVIFKELETKKKKIGYVCHGSKNKAGIKFLPMMHVKSIVNIFFNRMCQ
jgi:hypothetical protein